MASSNSIILPGKPISPPLARASRSWQQSLTGTSYKLALAGGTPQTPEIQKQNAELQQGFQIQGFPTIYFVNAENKDGKVNFVPIDKTGYVAGGPAAWLAVADGILAKK